MNITVEGGKSKKLLTGGKYCPEDITVTAEESVLSRLFEVVETFTPAEDVMRHEFYFPKIGSYVIVSDPPSSPDLAAALNATLVEMGHLRITSPTSSIDNGYATPSLFWHPDGRPGWWRTVGTIVRENVLNITLANDNIPFKAGFTYYLIRCNW